MGFFFNTNALVCVFDRTDSAKQSTAPALVTILFSARDRVIRSQVLQALYVTLNRKKHLSVDREMKMETTIVQERAAPASADLVLRGLSLNRQAQLLAWGALNVQSAPDAGSTTLCSNDFPDGMHFGALIARNPFVLAVHRSETVSKRSASNRQLDFAVAVAHLMSL